MFATIPRRLLAIFAIGLLTLGGCNSNAFEDYPYSDYATVEPNAEDVVGIWVPDAPTIKDMKVRGGYAITSHQIIINSDGTYLMMNLPDWLLDGAANGSKSVSHHKFFSTSGKWHFEKFQDWWAIVFEHSPPDSPIEDLKFNTVADVCYDKPPHLLHFVLSHLSEGDDGDESARFQRR